MYINSKHEKAEKLMEAHKFEEALLLFNDILDEQPKQADILSLRGVVYLHLNQKLKSLTDLEKALNLEKDNAYRYASLAYATDYFGDLDKAITLYEQAIQIDPDDAISYNNLGLLLEKKGYKKKAQQTYEKADYIVMSQNEMKERLGNYLQENNTGKTSNPLPKPDKNNPLPNKPKGEPLQPKKMETDEPLTFGKVSKDLLTKKDTFKDFMKFIKNGFKLKEK